MGKARNMRLCRIRCVMQMRRGTMLSSHVVRRYVLNL